MTDTPETQQTLATFQPHVNETFSTKDNQGQPLELTLYLAGPLPENDYPGKTRSPFELRFTAPGDMLEQRCYDLDHPVLGSLQIFLVPIRPENDLYCYQAVFN